MPPGIVDGSLLGVAHPVLDLGEGLLDRIEVRRIGWEIPKACTGCADHLANGVGFVGAKIVHDDDIARLKDRHELLFDIGPEALPIDRPVEDARSGQAVAAQCAEEGQGAPVAMRGETAQPLAFCTPAIERFHVGLDPGFIDEDQSLGVETRLKAVPTLPAASDVGASLLKGEQRLWNGSPLTVGAYSRR